MNIGEARKLRIVEGGADAPPRPIAPSSFTEAFRRHYGLVCHMLGQYGVERAAIDDVAQEVFLVVHRRWDSFDGRGAFTHWLVGITRRVARDHRRSRRRAWLRRSAVPAWRADPATPLQEVTRSQAQRHVERFLADLPLGQREVFTMAEIVGLSGPEIAEALGIPLNTVYSRLRLARRRFEVFVSEGHQGGDHDGR